MGKVVEFIAVRMHASLHIGCGRGSVAQMLIVIYFRL